MILPKRFLGKTGIQVSPLGLGTVKFGRNQGVKYPYGFEIPNDQAVLQLLSVAKEQGINLIDTAPAYGQSEERLGQLLKQREDWVICTKVGEEFDNGVSEFNFSGKHTELSIHRSLKRLNTDYLDMVLVHSDGNDLEIIEHTDVFQTLINLKEKGVIRSFGMSSKTTAGGLAALAISDIVMVTYNLCDTTDKPVIECANQLNKGILIKKALASGHICHSNQHDPVHESLNFVLGEPGVTATIVGTINPKHLIANCQTTQKILKQPTLH